MNWIQSADESSNVKRFGYDEPAETLYVEFVNGKSYKYLAVPLQVALDMRTAPSKGSYLASKVKGVYGCEAVASF